MFDRTLTFFLSMCVLGVYLSSTPPHLISDLVGGMLAVLLPFYLFPERRPRPVEGARGNWTRGFFYFLPAAASLALAVAFWPWSSPMLWPAHCYALVSFAYFAGKPAAFQKAGGVLDWAAAILLAPHVWMSKSSLPYLRRRVEPWAMAGPNVFFGRLLSDREPLPPDTEAVLDLNAEQGEPERLRQFEYLHIAVLDQTLPTRVQLNEAVAFLERRAAIGPVYVHCTFGYSRSAGVVAAWMLKNGLASSPVDAVQQLRARRPQVALSRGWMQLLEEYKPAPAVPQPANPVSPESSSRR